MSRISNIAWAALGLSATLLLAGAAFAASYRGESLDGKRYQASILNADFGRYDNVEVRFQGDHAYVYMQGRSRLVLILDEEEISDPHRIPADDPRHGVTWEINLKELVGH